MTTCGRCGQPLTGSGLWSECAQPATCERCGIALPPGWSRGYCPPCQKEYAESRRDRRRKGR
jgi:hypothetical protein